MHGKPLIEWHLEALAARRRARGRRQHRLARGADRRRARRRLALRPRHRATRCEGRDHGGALETAGGIAKALPLLGDAFWVVSADVYAPDFRFSAARATRFVASGRLGRLWLVPNPHFHPRGDFGLDADGLGLADGTGPDGQRWTYANIALRARRDVRRHRARHARAPLAPLLYAGMRERRIGAEIWRGRWENVGTPEQLAALNASPA